MGLDAQSLLAGPRGRRLCLELACLLDERIGLGAMQLGAELDTSVAIHSILLFGAVDGADTEDDDTGQDGRTPPGTVEELAQDLAELDLAVLDLTVPDLTTLDAASTGGDHQRGAHLLHRSLSASVEAAMYWQEPDGQDALAALPEIREAMVPLAHRVAAAAPVMGWDHPCASQQWILRWSRPGSPDDSDPHRDVHRWAAGTQESEATARAERPRDPRAAWSGSWWSTPLGLQQTVDRVPAALDLVEDEMGWVDAWVTPVHGPGRTFEITGAEDWIALCREHPLEVSASRRGDWYRVTGRDGRWVVPDWEQVAPQWDAVHLTVAGYLQAATRALEVDADTASVIGGWDPGSTYWLTSAVPAVTGDVQRWRHQDEGWVHTS